MKTIIPTLFCVVIFASCSLFDNKDEGYQGSLAIWTQNKSSNYEFTQSINCFCPFYEPAIVVVKADTVYRVLDPQTGESLKIYFGNGEFVYAEEVKKGAYRTIDELFEVIEDAKAQNASILDVNYNFEYGYPEQIYVDYKENFADDERTYSVSNFSFSRINN